MSSGIRKQKKKWKQPLRMYEKDRIAEENSFMEKYGLKNKKEIWKAEFAVKKIRNLAKNLITSSQEEQEAFILRLSKKGLIKSNEKIDDVLALTKEQYVERRLQTIVHKKGLAKSAKQARQMITHRKVVVGERIINIPSYLVNLDEEQTIKLKPANIKKTGEAKNE